MLDEDPTHSNAITRVFKPGDRIPSAEIRVSRARDVDDDARVTIARLTAANDISMSENDRLHARVAELERLLEARNELG
jgi:hypothetical protein